MVVQTFAAVVQPVLDLNRYSPSTSAMIINAQSVKSVVSTPVINVQVWGRTCCRLDQERRSSSSSIITNIYLWYPDEPNLQAVSVRSVQLVYGIEPWLSTLCQACSHSQYSSLLASLTPLLLSSVTKKLLSFRAVVWPVELPVLK